MWTTERVEALKSDWTAGRTCAEIADRVGKSRNAVIGKAHRMGLMQRREKYPVKISKSGRRQMRTDGKIKSVTLNITKEIIEGATRENSAKCMIAQAIRYRGGMSTHVTAETVAFNADGYRYTYPLPAKAAVELIKFDEGKPVGPFKILLSANTGFARPCAKMPQRAKTGEKAKSRAKKPVEKSARRCERRFHGLRMIEVAA